MPIHAIILQHFSVGGGCDSLSLVHMTHGIALLKASMDEVAFSSLRYMPKETQPQESQWREELRRFN